MGNIIWVELRLYLIFDDIGVIIIGYYKSTPMHIYTMLLYAHLGILDLSSTRRFPLYLYLGRV